MEQAKRAADFFKSMVNLRFFWGGYRFTARIFDWVYEALTLHNLTPDRCFVLNLPLKRVRSGVPRLWTCESILLYQQNHLTNIQYKPQSMLNSMSPPVQIYSLTLYLLPQIFCRLLHSHIFNTDYQPLPRKATTMAEYLCEG